MKRGWKAKNAWEERFETPRLEALLAVYSKTQAGLIEQARSAILAMDGATESITWLGIPWRWTLAYGARGSSDRPIVYLVPQPGKPLLALPMSGDVVSLLPVRRLPKYIRDVIAFSPKVAGVHWMQWELTGRTQVDELVGLVRHQHSAIVGQPA
ncbi:MAG: hypothetical protein KF678_01745 [Phycisphaeraceae bacterium]|nr:hypothetical protein [Phycisphaeraceae bacterium]